MKITAPGPDSARYHGLRRADPGCHTMARVFSWCFSNACIPSSWKVSNTVLIHKPGDRNVLNNWIPISLGNTIGKLYTAVLADRISSWASHGNRVSPEQKGFTDHEGCMEHNFVLQMSLEDARRRGEEVCIAWLDLANAFGSIPQHYPASPSQLPWPLMETKSCMSKRALRGMWDTLNKLTSCERLILKRRGGLHHAA